MYNEEVYSFEAINRGYIAQLVYRFRGLFDFNVIKASTTARTVEEIIEKGVKLALNRWGLLDEAEVRQALTEEQYYEWKDDEGRWAVQLLRIGRPM